MKKKIAKLWVAALRSGDYKQGQKQLRNEHDEFCCLGVLCNLHAQAHPEIAATQLNGNSYLGDSFILPDEVMKWAGMKSTQGNLPSKNTTVMPMRLTRLNDQGEDFNSLANTIEKHWESL